MLDIIFLPWYKKPSLRISVLSARMGRLFREPLVAPKGVPRGYIFSYMSAFDAPLSNKDLAILLIKHGIVCRDTDERLLLEKRVEAIGYYRLEEYTWPFRRLNPQDKSRRTAYFKQKISFAPVWNTYLFDRKLRFLLMDAIERFEIALRNAITQLMATETGTNLPHTDTSLFPMMLAVDKRTGKTRYQKWSANIQAKYDDSGSYDPRIEHCKVVHGIKNIADLPIWIVMELTTFGNIKTLYENLRSDLKAKLASNLGVEEDFLTSSFILLHQVRNRCAHHKRIWNYLWMKKTKRHRPLFAHAPVDSRWYYQYDKATSEWSPVAAPIHTSFNSKDTVFVFILCGFWLDKIAQTSHWKERVEQVVQPTGKLLKAAGEAGFSQGWNKHPLW